MATASNLASLNLIRPEVDANLEQVESQVGSYVEDPTNPAVLVSSVENMAQVLGALRLAELSGAIELADALTQLLRQVQASAAAPVDEDFAALGQGIMVLGRYLEYVQLSQKTLPQLLLPAINQIRAALHQPLLDEGAFLALPQLPSPPSMEQLQLTPAQLDGLVRRARLMYQSGLIAVLRGQGDVPYFRMMSRACERAQQVCGQRPQALLWWSASAALEALQFGVEVNAPRKLVLGQLDRQLKALARNDGNGQPDRRLLADCLYIVMLAGQGEKVARVRQAFALEDCPTEAQVNAEYELMCGPGGSVIRTVAEAVRDELAQVKDTLDIMSRGSKNDAESYVAMADSLGRMSQTLVMLGLIDDSQAMRRQSESVRGWGEGAPPQSSLDGLVDALMSVENAVAGLVRRVTPGAETQINNSRISLHQLDEARALLVAESRSGLSLAKRGLSSYLESSRDLMHLTNVPATLQSVVGGLAFLGLPRCGSILRCTARFIDERMLNAEEQPGIAEMETLADAISSVDYYLESLEAGKPMGEGILEIAEDSVAELGYPVEAAQAA